MRCLLDINVLIALAWPTHVHHEAATHWFNTLGRYAWATCPLTRLGFVRVSSNPRFVDGAVSPVEAHRLLVAATRAGDHLFWPDDVGDIGEQSVFDRLTGHQQVTDAYLIALASEKDGKLATFDRRLATLTSNDTAVEVIEAG